MKLEDILNRKLADAMQSVQKEVLDDFEPLVVEAFRRRMGTKLAEWGLSTKSQVSVVMNQHEVIVKLGLSQQLLQSGDRAALTNSVVGAPEKTVPPAKVDTTE